jgi:hypothetical protein
VSVPILEYGRLSLESGVVYAISHESLRLVYVGVAIRPLRRRIKNHIHEIESGEDTSGLVQAWRSYGPEALRVSILERNIPRVLLAEREDYWQRTLEQDYQLLNTLKRTNYPSNFEYQEADGVTYLIYGSTSSTVPPLHGWDQRTYYAVGDIFARIDDGMSGGGGSSTKM